MIRLAVSVEGQTEEAFVKDVVAEHLLRNNVAPHPILLGKARTGRRNGGNVSIQRLVSEMVSLHHNFDAVTSLVDFYGFRDREGQTVSELEEHVLREIQLKTPNARCIFPYVQQYEFEGLLFSDAEAFEATGRATERNIESLRTVRAQFATPEDINDDPNSTPGKRIARILSGYRKPLHGPLVARRIGLTRIREECPRFDEWLTRLEGLA